MHRGEKTGVVKVAFLTDIKLPAYQPRQYFDETKLAELTQTIKDAIEQRSKLV